MEEDDPIVQRMQSQIDALQRQIGVLQAMLSDFNNPLQRVFLARRTGEKTWAETTLVNGVHVDWPAGRACTSGVAASASTGLAGTSISSFPMMEIRDGDNFRYIDMQQMSLVLCAQTGGSAGTRTTPCSFTYTITTQNGTTIATGVALAGVGNRVVNAAMTAGTIGIAYRDTTGAWKLLWVDEKFTQTNC